MEVRVEAVKGTVFVEDLKLRIHPQGHVWVTEKQLKASACLQHLTQMGQVRVTFRPRCKVAKDPPRHIPIAGALSRPRKGGHQKPFQKATPNIQQAAEQAGMKPEEVKAMVSAAASQAAQQAVEAVMGQITAQKQQGSGLEGAVLEAVQKALGGGGVGAFGTSNSVSGPEEPIFIPTGIVKDGLDTDVKVHASDAEAGDLDAAAEALKRMKKSKKRRKKD